MHETSGSASLWSDGRWTYVLLFNGSDREMRALHSEDGHRHVISEKTLSAWNISFPPRHFTYRSKKISGAYKL